MKGHRDLRIAVVAAAGCTLVALLAPFEVVRLLATLPLALFLPGYAIVAATFARHPLPLPMTLTLSAGLSLIVLALGGLVLHFAPGGVGSLGWATLLFLVVLGGSRQAALARTRPLTTWHRPRIRPREVALLLASLAVGAGAVALALTPQSAGDAQGFTELWILPAEEGGGRMRVGVSSQEQGQVVYRLYVRQGDQRLARRDFSLSPGGGYVTQVRTDRSPDIVTAALFRQNRPDKAYRRVWAFPSGTEASP